MRIYTNIYSHWVFHTQCYGYSLTLIRRAPCGYSYGWCIDICRICLRTLVGIPMYMFFHTPLWSSGTAWIVL